ncbi:MAG: fused MFS/spermidine synthase [Rhodospirillaceae bacterium]
MTGDGETLLFEAVSAFNVITVTEDGQGLRALWFGKDRVRQSVIKVGRTAHLESPYPPVILAGFSLADHVGSALVLGLGGGVIPSFLRTYFPDMRIDVVEVDPVVVGVAARFFGVCEDGAMSIHVEDGRRFLERCGGRYDVIVLDVAGTGGAPAHMITRDFLDSVRGALTAGGLAIANVWNQQANPYYDATVATYRAVFESLYIAAARGIGNQVFFALTRATGLTAETAATRAQAFSKRHGLPLDLSEAIRHGFRNGNDEIVTGWVLRDPGAAG